MNFYVFWYHADPPVDIASQGRYSKSLPREDIYDDSSDGNEPTRLSRLSDAAAMGA